MYIRLVVNQTDHDSTRSQGIITCAYTLRDEGKLTTDDYNLLMDLLEWFGTHLPAPKNRFHLLTLYWFKDSNQELIAKAWEIAAIIKRYGYEVSLIKTSRPGYIVYDDEYQVAAVPFKDTRTS